MYFCDMPNVFRKLIIIIFLLCPSILLAQSQEDFEKSTTEFFMNSQDSLKSRAFAMSSYDMVEQNEDLQTLSNYYMLKAIFDMIGDEALSAECEKKAKAEMEFSQTIEKPESYDNYNLEWAYEYQMELYKSNDLALAKKALKFLKQYPDLINFTNYSAIANFYERNMDFEKAEEYYALAFDNIDYENGEFVSLIMPAFFYMKAGQYEKVEECLQLNRELLETATQYTRTSYESSGDMIQMYYYLYIGDYFNYIQSSERYFEQQYELNKDNLIGNPYASIMKLNKAIGYEQLRKYDDAEQSYRESELASKQWLADMQSTYPKYQQESFPLLNVYLAKRGELGKIKDRVSELDHYYEYIESFSSPGQEQLYQKAIQYALYRDARYNDLFKELIEKGSGIRNFSSATGPYAQYAYFLMRARHEEDASKIYDELFEQNLEWINELIFTFGEKAFVAYFTTKLKEGYDNYHSFVKLTNDKDQTLHQKLAGQAYDNLLLTKSISFKGVRKRKQAFTKANDPEVNKLYQEWLSKKQKLIRLYQMTQDDKKNLHQSMNLQPDSTTTIIVSKEQLEVLQKEVEQLENKLALSSVGFKESLEIKSPKWQSVRASLKPGEAAIEIVRFHWRDQIYYTDSSYYAAYIIRYDSEAPEVAYLSSFADDLDKKYYNFYRNSIKLKIDDPNSYEQYWKPIKLKLQGIKKVYYSPDGIYHLINMSTLKNPETEEYLLDEMELINVTSTAQIGNESDAKNFSNAVLLGRPAYSSISAEVNLEDLQSRSFSRNFRNANISDLPGTEDEVISIGTELQGKGVEVEELLGFKATEDRLYELQSPDVLHIATHGFWSGTENATPGFRMFNAMMNSGLLMAGVVDYYSSDVLTDANDGILTAYEAQNLNLEGTDLVVLSACETGLGDFDAGEGVYGLQRAFRAAGAKSIITTLWKIDDQATKDFMIAFYQQILLKKDRQEAFREAQLEMKQKYESPYYWGAFVLTGG